MCSAEGFIDSMRGFRRKSIAVPTGIIQQLAAETGQMRGSVYAITVIIIGVYSRFETR